MARYRNLMTVGLMEFCRLDGSEKLTYPNAFIDSPKKTVKRGVMMPFAIAAIMPSVIKSLTLLVELCHRSVLNGTLLSFLCMSSY